MYYRSNARQETSINRSLYGDGVIYLESAQVVINLKP